VAHQSGDELGDDANLLIMDAQVRRFNLVGDTTYMRGKVTRKWIEADSDDSHRIECDVWAEDQRGELTAKGTATIGLPKRK